MIEMKEDEAKGTEVEAPKAKVKMVDVKITREDGHRHKGKIVPKGSVIPVSKDQADRLVLRKIAEISK